MSSQAGNEMSGMVRFRSSLACVTCRSRHVKCDAHKPSCTRCRIDGKTCYFMKSRRGMRKKAHSLIAPEQQSIITPDSGNQCTLRKGSPPASSNTRSINATQNSVAQPLTPSSLQFSSYHCSPSAGMLPGSNATENTFDKNICLYYTFFHNAHPWVVPRPRLERLMQSNKSQLQQLLIVMEFVGSNYTPEGQDSLLKQRAVNTMSASNLPQTAFTVQALLILAIGVHCCSDFQQARDALDRAISMALEIGMYQKGFPSRNGNGDPVLEESWRRTWWGLFVVDGSFAAIQRSYTFKLWHVQADVDLPCEEIHYLQEDIPPPHSLEEYNEREFAADEVSFSSFAYLIDTCRILGSVMAALRVAGEVSDSIIDDADGSLVNWKLHLPDSKKEVLRSSGEIDEPLFQAHMHFNVIQVFLHRPRSRLIHSPVENLAKCAPPPPPSDVPYIKRRSYWLSTKKTLDAAEQAINLFTHPTPLAHHTPIVVCGVALSILAQLSACSYVLQGSQYETARNRIRLGIGTLKEYGKTWPVGSQTLSEIKAIAREVFAMKSAEAKANEQTHFELPEIATIESLDMQSFLDDSNDLEYPSMTDMSSWLVVNL